jgi:uncharacterized protein YndB with AHSA1/START domain
MSRSTYTIEINRPADEVFRYLDTSELAIQWLSGLTKITPITTGGNRVGAQAKHTYNENGREFEMLEETLIYEPNRRVKIKGVTDMFEITAQYTLTPIGERTRLDFEETLAFKNFFMRLLAPLITRLSKNHAMEDFKRLKSLVEGA